MSNKVNGLWAVNSSSVFMFFDSVNSPSVWRFEMKDGVESWRMIPGVKNAQAVRGVAAAYRADGGTWLDPNGPDYAQAVSEIGDVPLIVERGDCMVSSDCGDYTAHGVSMSDADREHGWELSYEHGGKARVVTIPGGKSVKELTDVFGGYVHKPRGFRDSKGRRVAYVAFDGKSGVVAYRDYYQRGSDQTLEESVAAYLAQHEIVEVA